MSARLADLLIRHPLLVMAVLLTVTAAAVALALQIQFDFAPQAMLKGDDNLVRELEDFKRTFAYEDSVLMIVLESTGETDVIVPMALTWQSEVARAVDALPHRDPVQPRRQGLPKRCSLRTVQAEKSPSPMQAAAPRHTGSMIGANWRKSSIL